MSGLTTRQSQQYDAQMAALKHFGLLSPPLPSASSAAPAQGMLSDERPFRRVKLTSRERAMIRVPTLRPSNHALERSALIKSRAYKVPINMGPPSQSHSPASDSRSSASHSNPPSARQTARPQSRSFRDVFDEDEDDENAEDIGIDDITSIPLPDIRRTRRMSPVLEVDSVSPPSFLGMRSSESPAQSQAADPTQVSPSPQATNDANQQTDDGSHDFAKQESPPPERLPFTPYQKSLLEDVNLSELMGGVETSGGFKNRVNVATLEEFEAIGEELAARYEDLVKKIAEGIRKRANAYTTTTRSLQDHRCYLEERAESLRKTQERIIESSNLMFAEADLHEENLHRRRHGY